MAFSSILLRCIARAAVKNAVNLLTLGVGGELLSDIWEAWRNEQADAQRRRADLEGLATASNAEVRETAQQSIDALGSGLSAQQRQQLTNWLTQVPAVLRRSMRRPDDPSGRTVPAGLPLRGPADLAGLLPPRLPRFKQGDRPAGIGDWQLVELLGVGGFGEVWKARNPGMPSTTPVALKFCTDDEARRQLENERTLLDAVQSRCRHPGIVPLLHTYLSANPPCLEYEYVEGGDLGTVVQQWHHEGKATPKRVNRLMLRLASIVGFAHQQNIVHRDLKPGNVLAQGSGDDVTLRVTDFGIGGVSAEQARRDTLGTNNALTVAKGSYTPLYASPQQKRGGDPDPRDDVYSLGVIWYQMLTGDLNAAAPTGNAWQRRLQEGGLSTQAIALLVQCLEERAEDRLANAVEIERVLRQILDRGRLRQRRMVLAGLGLLGCGGLAGWAWLSWGGTSTPDTTGP